MEQMKRIDQWTPQSLLDALRAGSQEEKLALVKEAGILTEDGELAPLYQSWGDKVSRTPDDAGADAREE